MIQRPTNIGWAALTLFLSLAACNKGPDHLPPDNKIAGWLYTSTNGEGPNEVVKFARKKDGSLTGETAYSTNSNGGADVSAGGDAHGDFDSQGGVQIIGNYLLSVNAGGNQVSVFSLDRKNGNLTFMSNTGSGGTRPVSIAFTKKAGDASDYWVVIGNQWNNPNVQKDGAKIERYPNDAFFQQDLSLPDATDQERNIRLFSFNAATGTLTTEKMLDSYDRENGGPTTVAFSEDGTKLAVSTWGIAHFDTQVTSPDEQHPSRVYVYDFAAGQISGKRYFEETGIAGTIGFSWARNSHSTLYVSNFNLIPAKLDNSVTVLEDKGASVEKKAHYAVTNASAINEACWTVLNAGGDKLYVASFQTNLISDFSTGGSGLHFLSAEARSNNAPHGDSKELWLSPDGRYLYNLGALQSFSVNLFSLTGGLHYQSQTTLQTTAAGLGTVGKYNFMGLTGFDAEQGSKY